MLFENDLVDELSLWIFPVVLGTGKRLFGSGSIPTKFELVKTATTSNGVIIDLYQHFADIILD